MFHFRGPAVSEQARAYRTGFLPVGGHWEGSPNSGVTPRIALHKPSKCTLPTPNKKLKYPFALTTRTDFLFFQKLFPFQNSTSNSKIFVYSIVYFKILVYSTVYIEFLGKIENSFIKYSFCNVILREGKRKSEIQVCL